MLYLVDDDVYLDLQFTQWGQGFASGGEFAYLRAVPIPEPATSTLAAICLLFLACPRRRICIKQNLELGAISGILIPSGATIRAVGPVRRDGSAGTNLDRCLLGQVGRRQRRFSMPPRRARCALGVPSFDGHGWCLRLFPCLHRQPRSGRV